MKTEAAPGDAPAAVPVATTVATTTDDTNALPFVAPCRTLGAWEPVGWLGHAWRDFKTAPRQSLTYGAIVVLLLSVAAWWFLVRGGAAEVQTANARAIAASARALPNI